MNILLSGHPGSGKSTLAREIGIQVDIEVVHLDDHKIYALPNYIEKIAAFKHLEQLHSPAIFEGCGINPSLFEVSSRPLSVWLDVPSKVSRLRAKQRKPFRFSESWFTEHEVNQRASRPYDLSVIPSDRESIIFPERRSVSYDIVFRNQTTPAKSAISLDQLARYLYGLRNHANYKDRQKLYEYSSSPSASGSA